MRKFEVLCIVGPLQVVEPFAVVASKFLRVLVRLDWQGEEHDGRGVPVHRRWALELKVFVGSRAPARADSCQMHERPRRERQHPPALPEPKLASYVFLRQGLPLPVKWHSFSALLRQGSSWVNDEPACKRKPRCHKIRSPILRLTLHTICVREPQGNFRRQ
jgi:hypothetical protein